MNGEESQKVIKRIREANMKHVLFGFIEPNIGKTVHIEGKDGIVINPTANAELFKFGVNLMTSAPDEDPIYSNGHIFDEELNFLLDDDFCLEYGIDKNIGLKDVDIEDYISLKLMIEENSATAKSYAGYIKKINAAGFTYPKKTYVTEPKKEKKGISVAAFKVEIDHEYDFNGKLESLDEALDIELELSMESLNKCTEARNKILYKINPTLTFLTRCIEFDMYDSNYHIITEGIENDYKIPGKRIKWQRLTNVLDKFNIRFRDYTKKV